MFGVLLLGVTFIPFLYLEDCAGVATLPLLLTLAVSCQSKGVLCYLNFVLWLY